MKKIRKINIDIFVVITFIVGNIVYHFIHDYLIKNKSFLQNIDSIYEKVKICLTSASIILAAIGFFLPSFRQNESDHDLNKYFSKSVMWLILALLSGIINVAIIPTHLSINDYLDLKHVSFWVWLYITGPLMYCGLILGILWFLLVTYKLLYQGKKIEE